MIQFVKTSLLALAIISLIGCSKDDDPTVNNVKMNGESFKIVEASIMGLSVDNGGHTAISLISGNANNVQTLTIDIESFTRETLEGTYSYPVSEGDKALDDWLTNYMFFEGTEPTTSNLADGTVTITHNKGDNYSIDMDLTMVDGLIFKGEYTGDFTVVFQNLQTGE
ncbi:hypothetical protein KEM09_19340 [Carboxylicivirga mesophila]|uniref:Lipocalin-like domain-containing protein n=1 Tax=Carboxylicivirga mesophila TaxID=1166478 RepID=A0ABS5KGB4_9BACT|nr:hypothetical protein [Carboxylicivirga mesophila]MBS2213571.1 hypothetical protein [Carboxylicivirga mesophila]